MANTLTGLIPTIYAGLDQVSRELIGFIPNVTRDATAEDGAVGQVVRAPVTPAGTLEDITPGADPANSGDQTISYTDVVITKSKASPVRWNGEEQLSVSRDGMVNTILADQFAQSFRALANAVEADLAALYAKTARAVGTAGTTPFATAGNLSDFAAANELLDQLGAPASGRVMVVGSAARAKLEGVQSVLFKANEAGTDGLLRQRQLLQVMGFDMGFSAQVKSHTKGTGTSYQLSAAGAVGDTAISVDTGSGTILAGDIVTFAGTADKYVVQSALSGGSFTIGKPGLVAAEADNDAVTVGNNYVANMFFHRNALVLAARQPAMPAGGDAADDVMSVTDPISGLTFQVAVYKQYRQVKYEVGLAWGVAAPNGKHAGILLG